MNCKICNKALVPCKKKHYHSVYTMTHYLFCPVCHLMYWPFDEDDANLVEREETNTKEQELQEFDKFLLDIHAKCIASVVTESRAYGYDDFLEAIKLFRSRISKELRDAKRKS